MDADFIVVGAGTAGLPAAIRAAERGASVLLFDGETSIGGTLRYARELSAAATRQQREKGIADSGEAHFQEVTALAKGAANESLLRLAVDNAADTIAWLESLGVRIDPDTPQIVFNHEAYKTPRTYWAVEGGSEIVAALGQRIAELETAGLIQLYFRTKCLSLLIEADRVAGVVVRNAQGRQRSYTADSVLLATGGYAANQALYRRFHGIDQILDWAPSHAQGSGLDLAIEAGASLTGESGFNLSFGAVMDGDGPARKILCRLNTLPQLREPWEIIVNTEGERFVREDEPSIDAQEQALMGQPGYRGFMVFDERIRRAAPDRMRKWYVDGAFEDFDGHAWFHKGETLGELAQAAGIDAAGLKTTVRRYNEAQAGGSGDALGREHLPAPIEAAPFYAIQFQGCNVISPIGIRTDDQLRALRADGESIPNLYVAGEIIGSCQLMGRSAAGGMMATPALTFGRLLGETLSFQRLDRKDRGPLTETG